MNRRKSFINNGIRRILRSELTAAVSYSIEKSPVASHEIGATIMGLNGQLVVGRLTVTRTEAAEMIGVSPRHFDRLRDAGAAPQGIQLGGRIVWRRADLEIWLADKMAAPSRLLL